MSLCQSVNTVDVRSGQGRFSEEVTSFKGLTAGEEGAAALWPPDHHPGPAPGNSGFRRFLTFL